MEAAIDLAGIVGHVTLIEYDTQLCADAVLQRKLKSLPNVTAITNAHTTEITGEQKVNGLTYRIRASGETKRVELEGMFIQIGLVPNTDWLKDTVELSKHGEIVVDTRAGPPCPACSRRAMQPPFHSSKSSSRPVMARRRRSGRSIT